LADQQNTEGGADLTATISNLTTSQVSLEATLQSFGQTSQISLLDYLR